MAERRFGKFLMVSGLMISGSSVLDYGLNPTIVDFFDPVVLLVALDLLTAFVMVMLGEQYQQAEVNHLGVNFWCQGLTFIFGFQSVRYAYLGSKLGFLLFTLLVWLTIAQSRYHYIRYRAERKERKEERS